MADATRWGILGCGRIAGKFAEGLAAAPGAVLAAVGSRSAEKAAEFAARTGAARAHGSYEALAADPAVDAIYVATPHTGHCDHTLLCLKAGKAVLCEKPFAVNAVQAAEMANTARRARVFLMEAMWTRFLPAMGEVRRLVADGAIGDVRMLSADFGFRCGWDPSSRLLDPRLAGGGLLDVGIYTVSLASMLLGEPDVVTGAAHIGETGVDEHAALILHYPSGALAALTCAVRVRTPHDARILGTQGSILVPEFWHARRLTLARDGRAPEQIEPPFEGNGYNYEAVEVARCLREGRTASAIMPPDESVRILAVLDRIRAQWALSYPCEVA